MISGEEYRRREAATMSEYDLLTKVRGLAETFGWMCYHTHDSRRSEPGFPDLVLIRGREVLFRELKTASGRVTPEQDAWLGALRDAGKNAGVWRPADLLASNIRVVLSGTRDPATDERLEAIARAQHTRRAAASRRR